MEESNPLYIKERKKKMFFKKRAKKMKERTTARLNSCLLLKRHLKELLEEKENHIYGSPIWVNSNLLVDIWNARIDELSKEIPEFSGELKKIKGYSVFGLPDEKKIPFDQISRGKNGKLYPYVTSERMITVRELRENQNEADWKFYAQNYETWRDCSDWQCSYANRCWPWVTYLISQYEITIPQMESNINTLIKELEEEICELKKKLANN